MSALLEHISTMHCRLNKFGEDKKNLIIWRFVLTSFTDLGLGLMENLESLILGIFIFPP